MGKAWLAISALFVSATGLSMQPEKCIAGLPQEIFLLICKNISCEHPWHTLAQVHNLKAVCKTWQTWLVDHSEISKMLNIPSMHAAAAMGNAKEIVLLKSDKHSLCEPDEKGRTPGDYAVGMKQIKTIRRLQIASALRDEQKIAVPEKEYTSQELITALQQGDIDQVETILLQDQHKVRPLAQDTDNSRTQNTWSHWCSALYVYALQGLMEQRIFTYMNTDDLEYMFTNETDATNNLKQLLCFYGANINAYNLEGYTALHEACKHPAKPVFVKFLLKCEGIDVNCVSKHIAWDGSQPKSTPLQFAVVHENEAAIKALLARECNVEAVDVLGDTALHHAAANNYVSAIKILVAKGADIYKKNIGNQTPLHYVAQHKRTDALVSFGYIPHSYIDIKDHWGWTPLSFAVGNGSLACMEHLISCGASVYTKSTNESSLLHAAVACEEQENLCLPKLFEQLKDQINCPNNAHRTPLYKAILEKRSQFIKPLVQAGASVNYQDNMGDTPMHYAASTGHVGSIRELYQHGANVNCVNFSNAIYPSYTPLHFAAFRGHLDAVKVLIECGADKDIKTKEGKTARQLAEECKDYDIAKFLTWS